MPSLDEDECLDRLRTARSGILGTVHPTRGPDLVPAVFALVADRRLVVPVDRVKPKRSTRLTRLDNLERDPRASLLVDRYDDDWDRLWWVRATGTGREATADELGPAVEALAGKYEPYRARDAVATAVVLEITRLRGWSAGSSGSPGPPGAT